MENSAADHLWLFGVSQDIYELFLENCAFLLQENQRLDRLCDSILRAQRIITQELDRLGWTSEQLSARSRNDPAKLAIAARLRNETTLTIKEITHRLHLGTANAAKTALHRHLRARDRNTPINSPGQKEFVGI